MTSSNIEFDNIAAYEILSEPRDKAVTHDIVRAFYEAGCSATQAVDPRTPCMVGGAPYYKLYTFSNETIFQNGNKNVIYTFDYFEPNAFVFDTSSCNGSSEPGCALQAPPIPAYPGTFPCSTLYVGWVSEVCPTWPNGTKHGDNTLQFNAQWHAHNLRTFATNIQNQFRVPLFANQFSVAHGVLASQGRYTYINDLLSLLSDLNIGWAWWTWAGGDDDQGFEPGSLEVVFRFPNGTIQIDEPLVQALTPHFN